MIMGGRLVVIPESYASFPIKILEILHNNRVNFIFWVPTIMVNIANTNLLDKIDLSCLKLVWFAGEMFPTKQFNYWRKYLCGVCVLSAQTQGYLLPFLHILLMYLFSYHVYTGVWRKTG